MMIRIQHRSRAFGMLGFLSLITLLVTMCAAVSIASMRSSAGSIRGIQRLQVLAAAEGAAVLIATGDAGSSGTLEIGECLVSFTPDAADTSTTASQAYQVTAHLKKQDRTLYSKSFRLTAPEGVPSLEGQP